MPTTVPRRTSFITFPEYVVFWPIILLGLLLPDLQKMNPDVFNEQTSALIWGTALVITCISCGMDFGRATAVVIFLLLVAGFLGAMWYGSENQQNVFSDFKTFVNGLDLRISHDLQWYISGGLFVGYVWMLLDVMFSSRRFEATFGQIERKRFLRGPQYYTNSRERPARAMLDDVLDYLLSFGGMRVYAYDAHTGQLTNLGLAVGWGSKLDELFDTYAESTPTHELT